MPVFIALNTFIGCSHLACLVWLKRTNPSVTALLVWSIWISVNLAIRALVRTKKQTKTTEYLGPGSLPIELWCIWMKCEHNTNQRHANLQSNQKQGMMPLNGLVWTERHPLNSYKMLIIFWTFYSSNNHQYIRVISDGSCEDWSYGCWKFSLAKKIKWQNIISADFRLNTIWEN